MDSSVYKYLIESLLSGPDIRIDSLPVLFAHCAREAGPRFCQGPSASGCNTRLPKLNDREALPSLGLFLENLTGSERLRSPGIPEILLRDDSFFCSLFLSAHKALADVLSGFDPLSHAFRANGIQLARFLAFCVHDDKPLFVAENDSISCAMFCFLTEGMMFAGWCPNAFEGEAKRAAHSYFIALKKSLHHSSALHTGVIIGYLWGAWLLAQKTEGIKSSAPAHLGNCENRTFDWLCRRSYIAINAHAPFLFYMLSKNPERITHPFVNLMNDGAAGLTLRVNNAAVCPVSMTECSEINRKKICGHKFMYKCTAGFMTEIPWTVVVLHCENTLYRTDIINFQAFTEPLHVSAEMRLESGSKPEPAGKNAYICKGLENTVVRFLDSPFTFAFDGLGDNGIPVFTATGCHGAGALKLVTAWATGKGITAINETKLLGIFE
jgi:hypothetical protein